MPAPIPLHGIIVIMDTNEEAPGIKHMAQMLKMENGILVMTGDPEVQRAIINNALINMLHKRSLRDRERAIRNRVN